MDKVTESVSDSLYVSFMCAFYPSD